MKNDTYSFYFRKFVIHEKREIRYPALCVQFLEFYLQNLKLRGLRSF